MTSQKPGHIWDDYRPEDYLWARLPVFARRVRRAQDIVAEWLEQTKKPYIAVSGGKDSVAMCHLVQSVAGRPLPVMWHDSGVEWPETETALERLRSMGIISEFHIVRPDTDVLHLKRQQIAGAISAAQKDHIALFEPIQRFVASHGFDGVSLGLRMEEGKGRKLDGIKHGPVFRKKDGLLRCIPVYAWTWQDVYAYIAIHRLPLHPIYSAPLLQLEHRGRIRLSWWASTDHHRHCEIDWVRDNFPDIYHRLRSEIPEVTSL